MNSKLEIIPSYQVAYIRQVGPYGPANGQAMEKLKQWAREKNLLTESAVILGIPQDNPEITPLENCRYDACIVLSKDYLVDTDDSINVGELPSGHYLVFEMEHTSEAVQQAWLTIFSELDNQGYQIDDRPTLERYTGKAIDNHLCELCVPVKAL